MDVTKNQNQIVSETEIPEDDQYSLRKIVAIWALATAPMTFFAFVLTPAIISHFNIPDSVPAFLVFWPLMIVGLVWQFVLSLIIVYRETGELRWRTMKKRMWYTKPRDPKTGEPRTSLFLWVLPFIALSLVLQVVALPDVMGTIFPFLKTLPHYNLSQIMTPEFQGAWYILGLTLLTIPFNYFLGEEFLFRGILLPKMNGVFGKWDWFFNGLFFALYHLHKPLGILNQILFSGIMLSYPSKRFRSNWMAVIIHGIEAPISLVIVYGVIVG
jgi:membrane protease YdiL (CAAX protease family)